MTSFGTIAVADSIDYASLTDFEPQLGGLGCERSSYAGRILAQKIQTRRIILYNRVAEISFQQGNVIVATLQGGNSRTVTPIFVSLSRCLLPSIVGSNSVLLGVRRSQTEYK